MEQNIYAAATSLGYSLPSLPTLSCRRDVPVCRLTFLSVSANFGAPLAGVMYTVEVVSTYYPTRAYWSAFSPPDASCGQRSRLTSGSPLLLVPQEVSSSPYSGVFINVHQRVCPLSVVLSPCSCCSCHSGSHTPFSSYLRE